jgi:FAD:protein FMN transferase
MYRKLPPFRAFVLPIIFVGMLFYSLFTRQPEEKTPDIKTFYVAGEALGTTWSVKLFAEEPTNTDEFEKNLQKEISDQIEIINQKMSTYISESELSLLNKNKETDVWIDISIELYIVLQNSRELSLLSKGAFDITIGPVVNLWGFGPDRGRDEPLREELVEELSRVGVDGYELHPKKLQIKKRKSNVIFDLSAIAKGFAIDYVAVYLKHIGYREFMVEIGGEVRTNSLLEVQNRKWKIGIERPTMQRGDIQEIVELPQQNAMALATSGDYRNYYELHGQRISHTIDARTGEPIKHNLASVSVIHQNAMLADGWATLLNVLGPIDGLAIAKRENLPVLFIIRERDGSFSMKMTEEFLIFCVTCEK